MTATVQAGPAPAPDSARPRARSAAAPHGRARGAGSRSEGTPSPPFLPGVPLGGRPAAAHLRAPGVLPVFPPEASAADLRRRPLRPRPPRPLGAGTARFRALRPASCGPSVASLPPAPAARSESESRERAASVTGAGSAPADDNKFVARRRWWRCRPQPLRRCRVPARSLAPSRCAD